MKAIDPGWVYMIASGKLIKIGKTNNPNRRLGNEAKTWLPDIQIIGVKPFWNMSFVERSLHIALVRYWYRGEWYNISDTDDYELIVGGFKNFYEEDKDMNSVDFIYWMNETGMAEFCNEICHRRLTLPRFQRQESIVKKETGV